MIMKTMSRPPDSPNVVFRATLDAARSGEPEAMEKLFEVYYPRVSKLVHESLARDLRLNRPWLTARFSTGDVVQEVFRSLLKDLSGFKGRTEDDFRGYLAMVIRNRLLDAIRFHESAKRDGRRTLPVADDLEISSSDSNNASETLNATDANDFYEVLQSFPEQERLLLRERLEQGRTFKNVASLLGYSSEAAARRAFFSAQALLVIRLGQRRSQ